MATTVEQPCYTLLNTRSDVGTPNELQLKMDLEKGDEKTKIEALKKVIYMIANGERLPGLLMIIIRFVLPLQNHTIKKLLLIFWEIVPKTTPDGKLLQEMILVCDAYRKDLQHPNEFLRGSTLRFLCKLKEPELLEPLMPAIRACLDHRHSYVRRNAVLAIYTIYRNFEFLMPDAPEVIANFLELEQDMSCKRNAFLMLLHADQEKALTYLASCLDQVTSFGDILQLVIVELVYKVCLANPTEKSRFIRCIYNLLNSSSPAVRYEAAGTLVTLSTAPTAIKAAASCYIKLIEKESDNNVKLIVLDRLISLKENPANERVLQDLVMDILRVLASPDYEVRKKTLTLVMELVSSRNIEELVFVLKQEISKTHNVTERDYSVKYRRLLVQTLHTCSIQFPNVAESIIPVLVEFVSDSNDLAATDVLVFIREAIQKYESLRPLIVHQLLNTFTSMRSPDVHTLALWILGEFAHTYKEICAAMDVIHKTIGPVPLIVEEQKILAGDKMAEENEVPSTNGPTIASNLVTSDGTYATQSAFSTVAVTKKRVVRPAIRQYMMNGNFYIGTVIGTTIVKLAFRYMSLNTSVTQQNLFFAEAMRIINSIIQLGRSGLPCAPITNDDEDMLLCLLNILSEKPTQLVPIFTVLCRTALCKMLQEKDNEEASNNKAKEKVGVKVHVDDAISIIQLSNTRRNDLISENVFELSLNQAVIGNSTNTQDLQSILNTNKLNKVTQLTGFSDPVYAEAYVNVNQYDIVLDVLIVNQTDDMLQNCTLEFATLGDLKFVERPQPVVLAPHDFSNVKVNVKVASTENAVIFGNIVYDVNGATSDRNVVVLNDINIDIMDYIVPATCTDTEFRSMWTEFEWENKVTANTNITDLQEYLDHLVTSTNMKCLAPDIALSDQCGFMAANLYAKSIFGESALANVSVEKISMDSTVTGHIRIRAKSQGMALSLGDKINNIQKKVEKIL